VLYIPAGTVHAIGPGLMIYEVQQSSNTTYRLYDWGRMGLDGNPRELHIEKGVQVSNVDSLPEVTRPITDPTPVVTMVGGEFFTTTLHRLDGESETTLSTEGKRFHTLTCIRGDAVINAGETSVKLNVGQSAVVPASVGSYALSGMGEVLRSWQGKAFSLS